MLDGVYQLSAVATDIKKSFGQDDVMVIVDNTPPIADAGPDQTITAGSEVTLSASNSKDVDWFGYFWEFGDGTTATAAEPFITHTYSEPGAYTVKLTVRDAAGNMDTDTATVNVIPSIIPATVDIKPDTLNIRSKGRWITAYIELPDRYSLKEVEISTIKLNDVIPAQKSPFRIGDYDCDGIPDLMVKFDRSSVKKFLDDPEEILTVTGKIGGKTFSGSDSIKVIFSKCKKGNLLKKVLRHKHCNFYNPEKYWINICFIWKVIRCLFKW
jgi:PKD repeat protein